MQKEKLNFNPNHDEKGRFTYKWATLVNVNFETELSLVVKKSKLKDNSNQIANIGKTDKRLLEQAKEKLNIDLSNYTHIIDIYGIKHTLKNHGNEKKENLRGQKAIIDDDFKLVPEILYSADNIEFTGQNKQGRETITYSKKMTDGVIYYVEEIRTKHNTLALNTMYKRVLPSKTFVSKNNDLLASKTLNNIMSDNNNFFKPIVNKDKEEQMNKEHTNAKDWASTFVGTDIMYEGIATYKDESVYLSSETLNRCLPNLKGKPVIIEHKLGIKPENMEKYAVGYVTRCGREFNDDRNTCEFVVFDDEAKQLLMNGYSLSTSYIAKGFREGGTFINTPYDREIIDLEFTHLAIVKNPRYEKVKVYQNEKENNLESEDEMPSENEKIEIKSELFNSLLSAVLKPFQNKKDEELEDKEEKENEDKEENDELEYQGEKFSIKELVSCFKKNNKNNEEEEEEEKEDASDVVDEENKENEEEEETKEDKEEKQNGLEEDWFEKMQELMNSGDKNDKIKPMATQKDAIEKGKKIYG